MLDWGEGICLKERFTVGIIAGIAGGFAKEVSNLVAYYLMGFTKTRFIDFSSVLLYALKPFFWWDTILAFIAQLIFTCCIALLFIHALPFINTRRYILKGVGFGVASWFVIYAAANVYKIPFISGLPWQTAVDNFMGSVLFGLVMVLTIKICYAGREEWGEHPMEDRFSQGLIAGGAAGLIQVAVDWLFFILHIHKIRLVDYASILLYFKKPDFWWDTLLALIAYLSFTSAVGIALTYLLRYASSKNHVLKGWYLSIITWFTVFAIGTMYRIPLLSRVEWRDATVNFITASIYGIVLAVILKFLTGNPEKGWGVKT
jgi:hypothetical protein